MSRRCPHCGEEIAEPDGRFQVVITCRDCTGSDPMGCGDGRPWSLEDIGGVRVFTTHEAACEAGFEATDGPPWDHEVVKTGQLT